MNSIRKCTTLSLSTSLTNLSYQLGVFNRAMSLLVQEVNCGYPLMSSAFYDRVADLLFFSRGVGFRLKQSIQILQNLQFTKELPVVGIRWVDELLTIPSADMIKILSQLEKEDLLPFVDLSVVAKKEQNNIVSDIIKVTPYLAFSVCQRLFYGNLLGSFRVLSTVLKKLNSDPLFVLSFLKRKKRRYFSLLEAFYDYEVTPYEIALFFE